MKKLLIILCCLLAICRLSLAQTETDLLLANEYYGQGEHEKAVLLYEKLAKKQQFIYEIHKNYLDALLKLQKYEEAEKYVKKQAKNFPTEGFFNIDYATVLNLQKKDKEAAKQLDEFTERIQKDDFLIRRNVNYYLQGNFYEYAEKLYLAGRKNGQDKYTYELAHLYALWGKMDKMIHEYLEVVNAYPEQAENIQNVLQMRVRDEEDFDKLETILVDFIQKYPEQPAYTKLLVWFFMQKKQFYNAFLQAKALDKRQNLLGDQVLDIARTAFKNKDYNSVVKCCEYLVTTYKGLAIYPTAKRMLVEAKEEQIKNTFPINKQKIRQLIDDYNSILAELGLNGSTAESARNMALLQAFYLNNKDTATVVLQKIIESRQAGVRQDFIDQAKLDLGDIYLLKSEPWEATLLYSQVEKTQKEKNLGHLAKLKNAKLYYYKGDFEFAKSQLDVLKTATTREISNDALHLSLLISDNLELDTSATALSEFAAIDLLVFQGQLDEALSRYDAFLGKFTEHSLTDEVYWAKTSIYLKQAKYSAAITALEKIMKDYSEDILADDANFLLATIYEENLKDKNKAMELYQKQLADFQGSIYTAEARKRFRALRGDAVN